MSDSVLLGHLDLVRKAGCSTKLVNRDDNDRRSPVSISLDEYSPWYDDCRWAILSRVGVCAEAELSSEVNWPRDDDGSLSVWQSIHEIGTVAPRSHPYCHGPTSQTPPPLQ